MVKFVPDLNEDAKLQTGIILKKFNSSKINNYGNNMKQPWSDWTCYNFGVLEGKGRQKEKKIWCFD